jgi:hypothetical protein
LQRFYRRTPISSGITASSLNLHEYQTSIMHKLSLTIITVALVATACSTSTATVPSTTTTSGPPVAMTTLPPATSTLPRVTTTTEPTESGPPTIETDPASGDVVDWYSGEIIVHTDPGTTVTVNGEPAEFVTDGSFTFAVTNTPGDNTLEITATDDAGNTADDVIVYEFSPQAEWIAALGDSVMLGAKETIEERIWYGIVDASVSRQFLDGPKLVSKLMDRPEPPEVIVIGLGTNGAVNARHFDEIMEAAGPDTEVVFVNIRVPRNWETESNAQIAAGVERYDNATLVDWFGEADERDELFAGDGFHPSIAGRVVLADLIAEAIYPTEESADST